MNHAHDDTDPVEHDPTGMRALLASLPDPGPMPADLVERITAGLAQEQLLREGSAGAVPGGGRREGATSEGGGEVVPLRRRSGGFRVLAAAAAVVGVLGLGGLALDLTGAGSGIASLVAEGSADSGAASGSSGLAPQAERDESTGRVLAASSDLRTVILDGTEVFPAGELGSAAASLPQGPFPKDLDTASEAPESGSSGSGATNPPVTNTDGARACATGLGVPATDEVVVRLAVVDDAPAAVLVATSPSGARTAWAVATTCSADDLGVLAGPVPVR